MPTIDELMQGKQPGEIKIRRPDWDADVWFQPYYKTTVHKGINEVNWWYGMRQSGFSDAQSDLVADWQLWQEPVATRCEECEKLRKERDGAVETLRKVWAQLGIGEWTK